MFILSIESSCDETSLALLEGEIKSELSFFEQINSYKVFGSLTASQIEIHKKYGGVVPEIGARQHAEAIHWLFEELLEGVVPTNPLSNGKEGARANTKFFNREDILSQITHIFVTSEPGLISALRVGMEFGKTIKFFLEQEYNNIVELVYVNHLEGHVISCFYQKDFFKAENGLVRTREFSDNPLYRRKSSDCQLQQFHSHYSDKDIFPHLHLLASGGNTQIILLDSPSSWQIVGKTLDDAVGECFDKIGRMIGLPYPGGVLLAKIAGLESKNYFNFPVSMTKSKSCDFSYSGVKTAVRYFLEKSNLHQMILEKPLNSTEIAELESNPASSIDSPKLSLIKKVAISSQFVLVEQLKNQFQKAYRIYNPKSIGLSGGVSANLLLRNKIVKIGSTRVFLAQKELTGDNAIMIALAGITKKLLAKK